MCRRSSAETSRTKRRLEERQPWHRAAARSRSCARRLGTDLGARATVAWSDPGATLASSGRLSDCPWIVIVVVADDARAVTLGTGDDVAVLILDPALAMALRTDFHLALSPFRRDNIGFLRHRRHVASRRHLCVGRVARHIRSARYEARVVQRRGNASGGKSLARVFRLALDTSSAADHAAAHAFASTGKIAARMTALHALTAQALSAAFRAKQLSPVEAARAVLARIEAWETKINAMYLVDAAGALAQATASEARWRAGTPLSALDGVPITIKDNIAVKGIPTPVGTAAGDMTPRRLRRPAVGAGTRSWLRPDRKDHDAGFRHVGFRYIELARHHSATPGILRAIQRDRVPEPARRWRPAIRHLALGTDIGGSVRLPAAYNGVFALKPSLGRVPIYPPYIGRVAGAMTRSVADAALLMTALTKPDSRDFMALPYEEIDWPALLAADVKGRGSASSLDIGVGLKPEPAVRAAIEAAAKTFESAGAVVEPVAPFVTPEIAAGIDGFFQARLLAEIQFFHRPTPSQDIALHRSRGAGERTDSARWMPCAVGSPDDAARESHARDGALMIS